ncbi:glycosyltransferase family 2 protein [Arthrobacter crystallopoietes]|uniref:glycosyltransferase n=1 Tax=Micrococcaceae TaxID=1268 RepID=UPI0021C7A0B3|nr:glycosyltransferase family 2 protein [Arthrobacter sp. Marseille-P9274]
MAELAGVLPGTTPESWPGRIASPEPFGPVPVGQVLVVVPVRNEEALLGACIDYIRAAMDRLAEARPGCSAALTLVLDSCTDTSGRIAAAAAARDPRIRILDAQFGSVGAARAAGAAAALDTALGGGPVLDTALGGGPVLDTALGGGPVLDSALGGGPVALGGEPAVLGGGTTAPEAAWIACTDADTRVPGHWLSVQATLADAGADAVLGTVEPDPDELDAVRLGSWRRRYTQQDRHSRIHGANLGVRASAYLAAGGFESVSEHEDVRLVARLRAAGAAVRSCPGLTTVTSGRLQGRTPAGFAGYLAGL